MITITPIYMVGTGSQCAILGTNSIGTTYITILDIYGNSLLSSTVCTSVSSTANTLDNNGNTIGLTFAYNDTTKSVTITPTSLTGNNYISLNITLTDTAESVLTYEQIFNFYNSNITIPIYLLTPYGGSIFGMYPTFIGIPTPGSNQTAIYYTTSQLPLNIGNFIYTNLSGYVLSTNSNFTLYTAQTKTLTLTQSYTSGGTTYTCVYTATVNQQLTYSIENKDCNNIIFTNNSGSTITFEVDMLESTGWTNITVNGSGTPVTNISILNGANTTISLPNDGIYRYSINSGAIYYLQVISCNINECWRHYLGKIICDEDKNCGENNCKSTCDYIDFFVLVQQFFQRADNILGYEWFIDMTSVMDDLYSLNLLIGEIDEYCKSCKSW